MGLVNSKDVSLTLTYWRYTLYLLAVFRIVKADHFPEWCSHLRQTSDFRFQLNCHDSKQALAPEI